MTEGSSRFLDLMNERRLNGQAFDFELKVEDQVFKVHRVVLIWKSGYFRDTFKYGKQDSNQFYYREPEITVRAAKACIDCMYTDRLETEETNIVDVLKAAHKWQVFKALEMCEKILSEEINMKSVVNVMNLSISHDLQDLRDKCLHFILNNLSEISKFKVLNDLRKEEILDLLVKSKVSEVNACHLWSVFVSWCEKSFDGRFCDIIQAFPFEALSVSVFLASVWNDKPVAICEKCKKIATEKFFTNFSLRQNLFTNARESLLLKKFSKEYGYSDAEKEADTYIVKNHRDVFACDEFLGIHEKDLLKYLEEIEEECSIQQFSVIVQWLKSDEKRHKTFKHLFRQVEHPPKVYLSKFLTSLGDIESLAKKVESSEQRGVDSESRNGVRKAVSWWPKNSLFLKSLAYKFEFYKTEAKIDDCVIRDFSEVYQLPEFKTLSTTDFTKYLSRLELYHSPEVVIWSSLEIWMSHDVENRSMNLLQLLESMLLGKFSMKFLREVVIKSTLVRESCSSLAYIMTILCERIEVLESSNAKMTQILKNHSLRFGEVVNRVERMTQYPNVFELSTNLAKFL